MRSRGLTSVVIFLLIICSAGVMVAGQFLPGPEMTIERAEHTATVLADGRVLIAGGVDATGKFTATAEVYDPANSTFTATGAMIVSRARHTATLLADGKVLIAGGGSQSAELFDPATGTFSATGPMAVVRIGATATRLPNGKVLLAAGSHDRFDPGRPSSGHFEVYDPATGTFSFAATYIDALWPAAAQLRDGRVLFTGPNRSELYDPLTDMFIGTALLVAPDHRQGVWSHTSTALNDGTVLVTGGFYGVDGSITDEAELYDPATQTFVELPHMAAGRSDHAALLLGDGTILIAGGEETFSARTPYRAEIYDPRTREFKDAGAYGSRRGHTMALLRDGSVLIAGGVDEHGRIMRSTDIYRGTATRRRAVRRE